MRAEYFSFVKRYFYLRVGNRRQPEGERPFGHRVFLCLHGAEPPDRLGRLFQFRSNNLLIEEAVTNEVGRA